MDAGNAATTPELGGSIQFLTEAASEFEPYGPGQRSFRGPRPGRILWIQASRHYLQVPASGSPSRVQRTTEDPCLSNVQGAWVARLHSYCTSVDEQR